MSVMLIYTATPTTSVNYNSSSQHEAVAKATKQKAKKCSTLSKKETTVELLTKINSMNSECIYPLNVA